MSSLAGKLEGKGYQHGDWSLKRRKKGVFYVMHADYLGFKEAGVMGLEGLASGEDDVRAYEEDALTQ